MKRRTWQRLCETLTLVGIIAAFALGLFFVPWLAMIVWAVFAVGNMLIYGGIFLRDASAGTKWFAAILSIAIVAWALYGFFSACS